MVLVPAATAAAAAVVLPVAARGGGRGSGRGGGIFCGRGGSGLGSASLASLEDDTGRPSAPRVSTTDADWDKLDHSQRIFFANWKPSAGGGGAQRARALMTMLGNVRGSHVEAANAVIAAIHHDYHPAVFPSALGSYSTPSATGAPDAPAGEPPPAPPPVHGS